MKVTMMVRLCAMSAAVMLASLSARAEKYQIVSNQTNAVFSSSGKALQAVGIKPADKVFANIGTAALVAGAHPSSYSWDDNAVSTNKNLGIWIDDASPCILVKDVYVTNSNVVLTVEERFLIYTNAMSSSCKYYHVYNNVEYWNTASTDLQSVCVDQECEPPEPWTTHGYAPYCRDEMTNRTEVIEHHEGVTREVVGYYDADGDGYATLSRVGVVHGSSGDYLDELADGPYWIVNDVLITQYTIPRNSYLNFVYGTEDAQNHYWYAIKSLYRIVLETTPLRPWWQMPEYQ